MQRVRTADVVIVGAGISGLAAASALTEQGYNVKILEARQEIGGRIRTRKLANGAIVDEGAHWVHTPDINPVTDIVREEGLAMGPNDPAVKQHFLGGRPISAHKLAGLLDFVEEKLREKGYTHHQMKHMSVAEAIAATYPMLQALGDKATATYNAGPPDKVGFLEVSEDPYGSGGIQLKRGMEALVDSFADYVGYDSILTGRAVTRIKDSGNHVELRTLNGEIWHTKNVIYTGSVGTLRNNTVAFEPTFPLSIREKLNHLHMGNLCKVVFPLDPAFAKANPQLAHLRIDEHSSDLPMIVQVMGAGEPVVTVITGADKAHEMERQSPEEVRATLLNAMKRYPPLAAVLPHIQDTAPHITRWSREDYIDGAYSYMSPGAERTGPLTLWNKKVHIAGEAFDIEAPGAVPGAITSGVAAAEEVMHLQERTRKVIHSGAGARAGFGGR